MGSILERSWRPLPDVRIRKAKKRDLLALAPRLRDEDKAEIFAASGLDPTSALKLSWKFSDQIYVVTYKDVPEMVFGSVFPTDKAHRNGKVVWFLSSDWIRQVPKAFVQHSKPWLLHLIGDRDFGYNWVDIRNVTHLRWLHLVGAEFPILEPDFGAAKLPFLMFTLEKK